MKQDLALTVLTKIMGWDDDTVKKEFEWLSLMSRMKYDDYDGFMAGARFLETLAGWLQQFDKADRAQAYAFVSNELIYIDAAEINHLVELIYPKFVQKRLQKDVSKMEGKPLFHIPKNVREQRYRRLLRETLFLGLSDGARIDVLRRATSGVISNEQVFVANQMPEDKWDSLLSDLRRDVSDPTARFSVVFLIDDFVGSGKTFLRKDNSEWKGKLVKFWKEIRGKCDTHLMPDWRLCIHHCIASCKAKRDLVQLQRDYVAENPGLKDGELTFGMLLADDIRVSKTSPLYPLTQRYYDKDIENAHSEIGGEGFQLGFSGCALPLVLEHNTPNNSVALLWAESHPETEHHKMRPLFRRRERHIKGVQQ